MTWVFIRESLDRTVKSVEDVERLVALPTLAVIPFGSSSGSGYSRYFTRDAGKIQGNGNMALSVLHAPGSAIAESYTVLRTSILLSTAPRPPQVLVVTSANPHEGKTCTSINLALSLAQRGGQVLIVDADLRRPGTSKSLGMSNGEGNGLSSYLTGGHDIDKALQSFKGLPNMWVLPAGPIPPNPAELVASSTMETLMLDLRQRFDHIVLDSPPLLMVTDGIVLSVMADGVILVVESGATSRGALSRACQLLAQAGARVLGTILNKMDHRAEGYYYNSHQGYYRND
jgi:capsular exopolysaccharide synthesis family protein